MTEKSELVAQSNDLLSYTLSVPLRSHLDRMLSRLELMPQSSERDKVVSLVQCVSTHWDQYSSHDARKTQLLGCALMVGEVEHLARIDERLERDRARIQKQSAGGKNKPKPEWHADCIHAANSLRALGTPEHNIVGILVKRFGKTRKPIEAVLEAEEKKRD